MPDLSLSPEYEIRAETCDGRVLKQSRHCALPGERDKETCAYSDGWYAEFCRMSCPSLAGSANVRARHRAPHSPIVAQIVPIRRCNWTTTEFHKTSAPGDARFCFDGSTS